MDPEQFGKESLNDTEWFAAWEHISEDDGWTEQFVESLIKELQKNLAFIEGTRISSELKRLLRP